jgi:ribosomal protein S26
MNNKKMIYNTIVKTIRFINNSGILGDFRLSLDSSTSICHLKRIYKITHPKVICFDVFRIQNILDNEHCLNLTCKRDIYRTIVVKTVLESIVNEYLIDRDYYKDEYCLNKACKIYAVKLLAINACTARKYIGRIDITSDSNFILDNTTEIKVKQ